MKSNTLTHRAVLAGVATLGLVLAAQAQTTLTPPAQRISDEAISADQAAYEGLQGRIKALNDRGRAVRDHHLAKAQCWLDVSFQEYTRNDRSAFPQGALAESEKLIAAMERGASPLPMDTPLVNGAARLRPDLWAKAEALRTQAGWRCAQAKAACAEVELVHAGNEHNQQGWRHAKPYVQIAEDLVAEASAQAAACVPPPEAPPVKAPVVVAAAPVPPPAPPTVVTREAYRLISQVVFNFDRHTAKDMRAASVQQLDGLLAKLRSDGLSVDSVRVVGHADRLNGTGHSDYNQRLSELRAATVRAYLVDHGIPADKIQSDAKGDSQPVEACTTAQAKGQKAAPKLQECLLPNRRVEVQVNASKR